MKERVSLESRSDSDSDENEDWKDKWTHGFNSVI
jgi:hypothetical protein